MMNNVSKNPPEREGKEAEMPEVRKVSGTFWVGVIAIGLLVLGSAGRAGAEQAREVKGEATSATTQGVSPRVGENFTIPLTDGVKLEMIYIQPGTFTMGSPAGELGRWEIETPHLVTLTKGYWLGKYEVTQAQYQAVMGANPSEFKGESLPVEMITWDDATEFCKKLTAQERAAGRLPQGYEYTLPTEAEWEYACRAGTRTAFHSGKNLTREKGACPHLNEVGWYGENSDDRTHTVGQKQPNAWGLYDMHGNVWEWCKDRYGDYSGTVTDPKGSASGSIRVLRGGGYWNSAPCCRAAYRNVNTPGINSSRLGCRLSLSLAQ